MAVRLAIAVLRGFSNPPRDLPMRRPQQWARGAWPDGPVWVPEWFAVTPRSFLFPRGKVQR